MTVITWAGFRTLILRYNKPLSHCETCRLWFNCRWVAPKHCGQAKHKDFPDAKRCHHYERDPGVEG